MSRSRKRNAALLAILLSCCLFLYCLAISGLMPACPSRLLVGLPCPGCGGGRSATALLRGDLCGALWYNPLSVLLVLFAVVSMVWIAVDIIRGTDSYIAIYRARWPRWGIVAVVVLLVANWIWNFFKFF